MPSYPINTALPYAKFIASLLHAHPDWQSVWLHNDGAPVLGILPKIGFYLTTAAISTPNLAQHSHHSDDNNKPKHSAQANPQTTLNFTTTTRNFCANAALAAKNLPAGFYTQTHTPCDFAAYQAHLLRHFANNATDGTPNNDASFANVNAQLSPNQTNPYHSGLIGFIGYDIAAHAHDNTLPLPTQPNTLLAFFGEYDCYLRYQNDMWELFLSDALCAKLNQSNLQNAADAPLSALLNHLKNLPPPPDPTPIALTPAWRRTDYARAFSAVQAYLYAGDAYQINLTQPFVANFAVAHSPALHQHLPNLWQATKAPFCGYFAYYAAHNDNTDKSNKTIISEILSVSPELFFSFTKIPQSSNILLTTKPIKGTRRRSNNTKQDNALKIALANSEKDRAENLMIVDLLRNDLGKYAQFGGVFAPKLFATETFSNVHHLVSTVCATLDGTKYGIAAPLIALFDSLPAGSITGSPKRRACQLIAELERGARGAYCGTMGYLNFNGTGNWNVLIRTLQTAPCHHTASNIHVTPNNSAAIGTQVSAWAGGGITVLSDEAEEYQECLDKIGQIQTVLTATD